MSMRRVLLALLLLATPAAAHVSGSGSGQPIGGGITGGIGGAGVVGPPGPGCPAPCPIIALDFIHNAAAAAQLTVTRTAANGATDLLPTSPSGAAYRTFADNTPRITPGLGLLVERGVTNVLKNSTAPATQTTGNLSVATWVLWVNGSGSATMGSGTGVGCGTGVATQGSPISFAITTTGTCTVTVSGSLNAFQLETAAFTPATGTSLIITGAAQQARSGEVVTLAVPTLPASGWSWASSGYYLEPVSLNTNQINSELDDGGTTNRSTLGRVSTTGTWFLSNIPGGTTVIPGAALNPQTWSQTAAANSTNSQSVAQDGAAAVTNTAAFTPLGTFNRVLLGSAGNTPGTAGPCFCYIGGVRVWNFALTGAQLATQSASPFGIPP